MEQLRQAGRAENVLGMRRFGISGARVLGTGMPFLRSLARTLRRDHALALRLWRSGVHEARILAALIDDPRQVTEAQMEAWVRAFDSWDLCDQCCGSLFDRTPIAYRKAHEWSRRNEEFVKRAGFALMAYLAVHDKAAADAPFLRFLPVIAREAGDERKFVRKAVNWALRQIGKRNARLRRHAVQTARKLVRDPSRSARWVGADALRELTQAAR